MATKNYFVTKTGRAQYPYLNKPDTQFDADGVYKVAMIFDSCEQLMEQVQAAAVEEFGAKAQYRVPWKVDEESGETVVKIKSKYKPVFVDSSGDEIPDDKQPGVYGGSQIRVKGTVNVYDVSGSKGVNLQLLSVQIITLSTTPSSSAGGKGFDAVEGGYVTGDSEPTIEDFEHAPQVPTEKNAARF